MPLGKPKKVVVWKRESLRRVFVPIFALCLWSMGTSAIAQVRVPATRGELEVELGLTEDQRRRIRIIDIQEGRRIEAVSAKYAARIDALRAQLAAIRAECERELEPIQGERSRRISEVLTPAQREKAGRIRAEVSRRLESVRPRSR
jgi:hypothetical protein